LQQRLADTSTSKNSQADARQQYVLLVQHLLKVPHGPAFFTEVGKLNPQVLAGMVTQLLFQFESGAKPADRETAASTIELLAAAVLDGLWKAQHWQVHKRPKDAAAAVAAAAKVEREAAEMRAKQAAWFAELEAVRATFPEQQTLSALSAADLKKKLIEEVRTFTGTQGLCVRVHSSLMYAVEAAAACL
jgi:hypothetical protein